MVYSTNSLSKVDGKAQDNRGVPSKPGDSKDFTRVYLQWNNEENVVLQSETWKLCCPTLLALE